MSRRQESKEELLHQMQTFAHWMTSNGYIFLPEIACKENATVIEISWIVNPNQKPPWLPNNKSLYDPIFEKLQYDKTTNTFVFERDGHILTPNKEMYTEYLEMLRQVFHWKYLRDENDTSNDFKHSLFNATGRSSRVQNMWRGYPDSIIALLSRSTVLDIDDAIQSMRQTIADIGRDRINSNNVAVTIWDILSKHLKLESPENFRNHCNTFWTYALDCYADFTLEKIKWIPSQKSPQLSEAAELHFWKDHMFKNISMVFAYVDNPQDNIRAHTFPKKDEHLMTFNPNNIGLRVPFYVRTVKNTSYPNIYLSKPQQENITIDALCGCIDDLLSPVDFQTLWLDRYNALKNVDLLREEAYFALQWCLINDTFAPEEIRNEWIATKSTIESLLDWKYTRHMPQDASLDQALFLIKHKKSPHLELSTNIPDLKIDYNS